MSAASETAIHRRVRALRDARDPTVVARVASGWVVFGEVQVVPGYCLLLPDPVVPHLNALDRAGQARFLKDMAALGEALLAATGAARINYELLGNLEPALHAHVLPRRDDEPQATRTKAVWLHDWDAAPRLDVAAMVPLARQLAATLSRSLEH